MEIFVTALTIFVLAIFVGFEVITKVPPTLHTPLAAVIFATINVVGGFLVTDRMLKMFKKK
jgi:NAD(P) transhydrogenase subunit alpha